MASISLNAVADDNKINSVEATTALPLSGTSSGIAAGTLVSIFVDGSTTPAAYSFLNADGSWHAVLDATGLDEGPHTITASVVSASVSSSQNVSVDTIAPSMSITQDDAAFSNAGTVHYSVTLSEAISGVTAANFGLATTGTIAGAAVTAVTTSDDIHFSVTVDTGSGDGTIALTTSGIKDAAGNGIAGAAFQSAVTTPANGTVANTFAADLNGDGRVDILSINSTNYETWLQQSDGTFQHNSTSLGVTFYSSALLGDVNGDGILDFLAPTSGGLLTYLGVGDGTFDFASSSNTSAGTLAIYSAAASGDFNGDGKLDVVVTTTRSDDAGNAWVLLGNGDGTFAPAVSYAVGARPTTVGTGDFNHDGKTDIVVVNQYGGTVGILLGNGDGTFQAEVDYAAGVNLPRGLAVGDLNGDGNPDLVIGNFTSGDGLAVLLGNSDGTFQTAVVYATGSYNNAINIGDIDGDGIPDLTVVNGGYNGARGAFSIYRGLGDGTFAASSDYVALDASGIPMPLAVADINGDGKPDLVTAGYFAAELAILYNAAPPGPAYTLDRTAPDAPSTPDLTAASDSAVDTDNITSVNTPTFTGTAEAGSTVTLYDTNGTTVLGTTTADASTGEWSITTSVLADGDHTITATATDMVGNVSDPSTGLAVKIDTVTPVVAAPDLDAASDTGWSSTDNLTKDNTPTFTGTTEAGATVTLYDTDGITVLGTATADETTGDWSITATTLADGDHTVTVQAADAAGNVSTVSAGLTVTIDTQVGAPTVALASEQVDGTVHYSMNGTVRGTAADAADTLGYALDGNTFSPVAPIFARDGSQDGVKTVTVRETDAAGNTADTQITFTLDTVGPQITTFEQIGTSLTNADSVQFRLAFSEAVHGVDASAFYSDGWITDVSLVTGTDNEYIVTVTSVIDGPLNLYLNSQYVVDDAGNHLPPASGRLSYSYVYDPANTYYYYGGLVATGDLNKDGNADFVVAYSTGDISLYIGNGDGTFLAPATISSAGQIWGLEVADIDNDGNPDLITRNASANGFSLIYGNGDGTFQSPQILHTDGGGQPGAFVVADFNNDGLPDVLTNTNGLNGIYLNLGGRTFAFDYAIQVGGTATAGDFNNDGNADLIYLSGTNVVVRLGDGGANGTPAFGPEIVTDIDGARPAVAKAVADIDGDGILDIVTGNSDGTVTVLLGVGDGTFTVSRTYAVSTQVSAVSLGDINGDGKLDIAASDPPGGRVRVLLGDGHGEFAAATEHYVYYSPGNLGLADFNGDGAADVVTKAYGTFSVTLALTGPGTVMASPGFVIDKTITASNVVDHDLVEATGSSAGTASAVATITIASDTSYDTAALTSGGWTDAGGGLWTQASTYGTATLDTAANTLTFALDNVAADSLTPSDHPTASFTIPVKDLATNTTTTVVTFTIDGANDAPTLDPTDAGTLTDTGAPDTFAALTGTLAGHDVDAGALLTYGLAPGQNPVGAYGTLTVDGDGTYRYVPNDAAIDALPAGAVTDTFNVAVSDGTATTLSTLSVTINGANDRPVFPRTSLSVAENATLIAPLTSIATDADGPNATAFAITGGTDAALFDIVAGNLVFRAPHDYESEPHSYQVELTASDGTDSSVQTITVALTDVNDNAPAFTSAASASEPENTPASAIVYTAHATDADGTPANNTITYALTGDDAALFSIDASTGDVRFLASPNFEVPRDADRDNQYRITVHANDGLHDVTHDVAIAVTDVSELFQWSGSIDLGARPASMRVAGVGDFDGDGSADVLWRNAATGQVDEWRMQNGNWSSSVDLGSHGAGWQVAGIGDFNGDGTDDILWRETATGSLDAWIMRNGHWAGSVSLGTHGTDWKVLGIGDFNGDRTADILFQNTATGEVDQWQMANGNWSRSLSLGSHDTAWSSVAIGDFDGDGTSDVLWHNPTTGQVEQWHMANGNWAGTIDLGRFSAAYDLAAVSDFNGDKVSDVVWRDPASGRVEGWVMHDGNWLSSVSLGAFDPAYALAGAGNFDHTEGDDMLWHDAATGQTSAWLLRSI